MKLLALILALLSLTGCIGYSNDYMCPNKPSDVHTVRNEMKVVPLPTEVLVKMCNNPRATGGCYKNKTAYVSNTPNLNRLAIIEHEMCHMYRIETLGISNKDEVKHKDWL